MTEVNEDGQMQIGVLNMQYATLWQDSDPEFKFQKPLFHIVSFSTDDGKTLSPPTIYFVPKEYDLPAPLLRQQTLSGPYGSDDHIVVQMETWLDKHAAHVFQTDTAIMATDNLVWSRNGRSDNPCPLDQVTKIIQ